MATTVAPTRPWRLTPRVIGAEAAGLAAALVLTLLVLRFTGFEGRLAGAALFLVFATSISAGLEWRRRGVRAAQDAFVRALLIAASLLVLVPLFSIMWTVIDNGRAALRLNFFTQDLTSASGTDPVDKGGAMHAIVGSIELVFLATLIAMPLGVLSALYLTEIKGRLSGTIRFLTQAMSGVPSVVAGLFVYSAWVLGPGKGFSGFAGALALAILMLPTVARTAEEVLKLVPEHLREAGLALGGTQWRTVATIVLPTARSGLVTAGILGVARIAGETAPLILTIFGAVAVNTSLFNGPMSSLPLYVFGELKLGLDTAYARAWTGALVLMMLVLVLFAFARWLGGRKTR